MVAAHVPSHRHAVWHHLPATAEPFRTFRPQLAEPPIFAILQLAHEAMVNRRFRGVRHRFQYFGINRKRPQPNGTNISSGACELPIDTPSQRKCQTELDQDSDHPEDRQIIDYRGAGKIFDSDQE